ncbi:hypothetical protein [Nocardia carnea]|uniref:hypothetical protein n=1 Tax=Nocardia carnea TaxID=37328 RepID=UPI002455A7F0|nr:hypothetical protein [Nocardia carnea]
MATLAPGPARTLTLPDLPCDQCTRPRSLDLSTGGAACITPWCSAAGVDTPLWWLLDAAGIDHNPAGTQRPAHHGMPIPWITPVTLGPDAQRRPHWLMIHRGRLGAAQRQWLCQHCGLAADQEAATVIVDDSGCCTTSAPLHPDCAEVSVQRCPHLARSAATAVLVSPGQLRRTGEIAPELGQTETWRVPTGQF